MNFSTVPPDLLPVSLVKELFRCLWQKSKFIMFCVKKTTMPLLFDNPFTSFGPPQARSHGGAFKGSAFPKFFAPIKFCFKHIIKRITLNCVFPQNLKVWLWAWLSPLNGFVILSTSNE